jgi:hypothetical protein
MAKRDQAKEKACVRARQHYAANRERKREQARDRMRRNRALIRAFILDYLKVHPCVDCGETNVVVLEFDHVRGKKEFHIGGATARNIALDRLEAEIAKCEVRCANCHRKRTYIEAGYTHKDV